MAKNDVIVKITQKQVAGSAGFGVPLIIQGKGTTAKEYAEYDSLDAVMEAGFAQENPIYKQCAKLFIQNSRPSKVAVCVGTVKVTETLNQIKDKDFRQIIPILGLSLIHISIADLAADWWITREQAVMMSVLKGILDPAKGALKGHVLDVSAAAGTVCIIGVDNTLDAKKLMGDAYDKLGMVFMHSDVYKRQRILSRPSGMHWMTTRWRT